GMSRSSATRTPNSRPSATADRGERQERGAARPDLDLGAGGRAYPAVEAWCPAAVVLFPAREGVLPVGPQPVALQAGIEVVPREHLVPRALAGGEPLQADPRQLLFGGPRPPLVGEVLAPAVEAAAVAPDPLDHRADPSVAPRE